MNVLKTKTLTFGGKDDFNKVTADAEKDCGLIKSMPFVSVILEFGVITYKSRVTIATREKHEK